MNTTTCYQKLVEAVIEGTHREVSFEFDNFPGFAARGHSEKEFRDWVKCIRWVWDNLKNNPASLNQVKELCRRTVSCAGLETVPRYRLRQEELEVIAVAERFGRGHTGRVLVYGNKDVVSYDYRHVPRHEGGRRDILVVFSGAPESAVKAAEAVYRYIRAHKALPDGVMFLGLQDNQNMTEFCPQFKIRKNSEYRMYLRQMLLLGIPKGLLRKLLMTPKDTSTAENIELIKETLLQHHVKDAVNLICVPYPLYQMRVATELSFGLQSVDDVWVRIADIEPKKWSSAMQGVQSSGGMIAEQYPGRYVNENLRVFSYDKLEMQLADLTLANCVAHLFREHGKQRFALPDLGCYPDKFKVLAPLFLSYSYPNVMKELCGTDEQVSAVLKIVRTLMLDAYDEGAGGAAWDKQQLESTLNAAYKLVAEGLVSPEILVRGRWMEEQQFLDAVAEYQNRCR